MPLQEAAARIRVAAEARSRRISANIGQARRISAKLGPSSPRSGRHLGHISAASRLYLGQSPSPSEARRSRDFLIVARTDARTARLRRDCAEIATGIAGGSRLPTPPGCEQEHGLDEALRSAEAIVTVYAFCARHFVSSLGFAARRGRAMVSLFFGTRYFFLLGAAPRRGLCQRRRRCRRRSR